MEDTIAFAKAWASDSPKATVRGRLFRAGNEIATSGKSYSRLYIFDEDVKEEEWNAFASAMTPMFNVNKSDVTPNLLCVTIFDGISADFMDSHLQVGTVISIAGVGAFKMYNGSPQAIARNQQAISVLSK